MHGLNFFESSFSYEWKPHLRTAFNYARRSSDAHFSVLSDRADLKGFLDIPYFTPKDPGVLSFNIFSLTFPAADRIVRAIKCATIDLTRNNFASSGGKALDFLLMGKLAEKFVQSTITMRRFRCAISRFSRSSKLETFLACRRLSSPAFPTPSRIPGTPGPNVDLDR